MAKVMHLLNIQGWINPVHTHNLCLFLFAIVCPETWQAGQIPNA